MYTKKSLRDNIDISDHYKEEDTVHGKLKLRKPEVLITYHKHLYQIELIPYYIMFSFYFLFGCCYTTCKLCNRDDETPAFRKLDYKRKTMLELKPFKEYEKLIT